MIYEVSKGKNKINKYIDYYGNNIYPVFQWLITTLRVVYNSSSQHQAVYLILKMNLSNTVH